MAETNTYILFAGENAWLACIASPTQAAFVEVPSSSADAETIQRVAQTLKSTGYHGESAMLALPAKWCFAASVKTSDLPRHDRNAMLYRMEEFLPFAAESLVADFIVAPGAAGTNDDSQTALGICCQLETVRPLLAALEAEGIVIQSISPADVLAAQSLNAREDRIVLFRECDPSGNGVNLVAFEGGRLARWSISDPDARRLQLEVGLLSAESSNAARLAAIQSNRGSEVSPEAMPDFDSADANDIRKMAAQTAREVLLGHARPWIELRRGRLAAMDPMRRHRRALNMVLAASMALLLSIACAFAVRAHRYNQEEQSARQQMTEAFARQYPDWALPSNVKVIVESEHRKAAALASGTFPTEARRTAMRTLLDVLGRLPPDRGYSLDKLTLDDGSFELQGEAASFEQLDAIASSIRQRGLDVPAPEARKTASGKWSFVVRGSYKVSVAQASSL